MSKKKPKKEIQKAEGMVGWLFFSTDSDFPPELQTYDKNNNVVTYAVDHSPLKVMILDKECTIKGKCIKYGD